MTKDNPVVDRKDSGLQVSSPSEVHILDLLIVLAKSRKLILTITGIAMVTSIVIVLLLPSRYTAETVVLPPLQNASAGSALMGQLGGSGALAAVAGAGLGLKNPGDMYVSLFQSRTVEDAVIQRFGLEARYREKKMSAARKEFEAHAAVTLGAKDGLIRVDVTDWDPTLAAQIANAYVDEFRKLSASLAVTEASQRREFFQNQLRTANENLIAAEEAMKKTEQTTGILQVDSQARSLIESAAALRAQMVAKQVQLQGMRAYATEDNPSIVEAKQQLWELQTQLAKLGGTDLNASSDVIMKKGNIPEAGMEYVQKLRDVKYYEAIADLIGKQFEVAKLDEARQGSTAQIVDLAVSPDTRSFPKRIIAVSSVTLLVFFVGCGWCVLKHVWGGIRQVPSERARIEALRMILNS